MAGALRIKLEKPGQYTVGDQIEELNANKIIRALKIRNVAIILAIFLMLPVIYVMNVCLFPF